MAKSGITVLTSSFRRKLHGTFSSSACIKNTLLSCIVKRHIGSFGLGKPSEWNKVVSDAERIVGYPTSFLSLRCLLSDELANVALQMRKLVGSKHPLLQTAKEMISDGKHSLQTRGLIVLLISKAAGTAPGMDVMEKDLVSGILPSQRSLAEITEIIHTANLIHKGVVNISDLTPKDGLLGDMEFGNKMAVLSGDFLLANACTGLAELENTQVVEIIAGAIGDLMEAEFTGFTDKHGNATLPSGVTFSDWLKQTYLSSGSLLAKSCQSAMKLASHSSDVQQQAYKYGLNTAYVQQLSNELKSFGKGSHLNIHVSSAPVIMLQERNPTLVGELLSAGVVNQKKLVAAVQGSGIFAECWKLCEDFSAKAVGSLSSFHSSDAKAALTSIVHAMKRV